MSSKTGRFSAVPQVLLLLALLLTMIPAGIAFGEGDAASTATDASATDAAGDAATADEVVDAPADGGGTTEVVEDAAPEATAPEDDSAAEPVQTNAAATGGAATEGPYDPNVDGSPSGNGNGGGGGDNRPCAGCVGDADDKNPPGQLPGPDDDGDNGYECDGNTGGGKTNPAHSGCPDPAPSIEVLKDGPATSRIGDTITYTFRVTNTGNTTLTNVYITDPLLGTGQIAVTPSTLPAGGSGIVVVGTASANYTVRAEDVVDNNVHNVATAHGTPPEGPAVTDTDPHDVAILVQTPVPAIQVVKNGPAAAVIGETITYTFNVTNTGQTALTNVHITDPLIGSGQIAVTPSTLAVGATGTASATYTVRSQDVVNNRVPNTATAHGTPPSGPPVTDTDDHVVEILPEHRICHATGSASNPYIVYTLSVKGIYDGHFGPDHQNGDDIIPPFVYNGQTYSQNWPEGRVIWENGCNVPAPVNSINLVKDGPASAAIGETITYTFNVTNTGDQTLTNVHITDPLLGTEQIAVTPSTLAPDQSGTASATYTVDEADVVDRNVHNLATATGTTPTGANVVDTDPHDVVVLPNQLPPSIELIKDGPASALVGDTITYTFRVTNTGDHTLTNVHITDPLLGTGQIAVTPSTLAAGAVGTASATYTVAQADVVGGNVHNLATAHGTPPTGPNVTDTDPHDVTIPGDPFPAIKLLKDGPALAAIGDTITYEFDVENIGTETLTNVHITDPLLGSGQIAVTPGTLAPGATGTATAEYTMQQIHVVRQNVHNVATVTGTAPSGTNVTDTDPHDVAVVPIGDPDPAINLQKSGPIDARKGDVITYTFRVKNTGTTSLANVHITDPMLTTTQIAVTPSTLAVNGVGTATATYTVTAADAAARQILNTATAYGTSPQNVTVDDDDDHLVTIPGVEEADPGIELIKTGPATANVGDTITYRFTAKNTGETVLTNVTITDPMLGGELTVTPSTLRPGESGTAKATYTVTEADGRRGKIFNTAIVTGDPPDGPPIEDEDDHTTTVPGDPDDPEDPDDPDLPATGTDAPTTLLISGMALLLGFALLRMTKSMAPAGPETWSIASPRLSGTQSAPPVHRRTSGRGGWSTPRIG